MSAHEDDNRDAEKHYNQRTPSLKEALDKLHNRPADPIKLRGFGSEDAKAVEEMNEKPAVETTERLQAPPVSTRTLAPTWRGVLPLLMIAYSQGTDKVRSAAKDELERMADLADAAIADSKVPK